MNQVEIEKKCEVYRVTCQYHSNSMCQNYDAKITAIKNNDGKVTFQPDTQQCVWRSTDGFVFDHSDPDRIIAITTMMQAFAGMMKKEREAVDTDANE